MNRIRVGIAAILFLSVALFAYAQQPGQESSLPNQQEPTKDREVAPPPRQPEAKPPHGQEENKPPKPQPEPNPPKPEKQEVPRLQKEQANPSHEPRRNHSRAAAGPSSWKECSHS